MIQRYCGGNERQLINVKKLKMKESVSLVRLESKIINREIINQEFLYLCA